jgi:tripartite-type tricarboxylate transporter receptor subunit TctC
VVVENRALGGSGTVATRAVAKGAPDGYAIVLGYTTTLATGPTMVPTAGYDVRKDFAPLGLIATAPALLLANPGVPAKTIQDVIALIKGAKEPYQIGLPSIGSVSHLAAEMFVRAAGLKVQFIPYKASQPLTTDLIAGHVKLGFNPIPVSRGAIEGGLIRAIAGTSLKRSSIFPDLPTIAEAGLPGVDAVLSYGLLAPGGTPQPIVDRLNQALRATLAMDDVKQRLALEGADPAPTTPAEHAAVIDREEAKFSALIKELGLKPQ